MNTNGLAFMIIGFYLVGVIMAGKTTEFYTAITHEKKFYKFGGAVLALYLLKQYLNLGLLGDTFIVAAFMLMLINAAGNGQLDAALQSFNSKSGESK